MARLNDWRRSSRPGTLVRAVACLCGQSFDAPIPLSRLKMAPAPALRRQSVFSAVPPLALAVLLTGVCAMVPPALAQTDVNDAHVTPRDVEKPKEVPAEVAKEVAKKEVGGGGGLSAHVRPLKVDVDLVLVPVTITDPLNRLVTGLDKENFQLFEGNSAQDIKTFSSEDAPVSLGVIFDSSGSMSSKMEQAKDAVVEFFKTANPQDEFFMITFG